MRCRVVIAACVVVAMAGTVAARQEPQPQPPRRGSGVVQGVVVLERRPLAGALVTLGLTYPPGLEAVTDERGEYAITGVPPGSYHVRPKVPGYAIIGEVPFQLLTLDGTEPPQRINFALQRAGSIAGRVLDADGRPLAGATVYLVKLTAQNSLVPGNVVPTARTSADGEYRFTEVQPGRYTVGARPPGPGPTAGVTGQQAAPGPLYYYPGPPSAVSTEMLAVTAEHPLTGVDIPCVSPATGLGVSGIVRDERTKQPVANARLIYGAVDAEGRAHAREGPEFRSDGFGRFTIPGLEPGRYWVGVANTEPGPTFGRPVLVTVAQASVGGLEVPVSQGLSLAGRVVFEPPGRQASTAPVTVIFRPRQIATALPQSGDMINGMFQKTSAVGPDGRFVLEGLPPGPGIVSLSAPGSRFAVRIEQGRTIAEMGAVVAAANAPDLLIVATEGTGAISGRVLRSAPSLQTNRLRVSAALTQGTGSRFATSGSINPDGRFLLENLPPGDYTVMIVHSDGRYSSRIGPVTRVQVDAGATATIEIDLSTGAAR